MKKKELIAEQESILETIDQLSHMEIIISNYEHIDVVSFCFLIHSILYEEENIEMAPTEQSILNFRNENRRRLDREYFSFIMDVKKLVAKNNEPTSEATRACTTKLMKLKHETLKRLEADDIPLPEVAEEENILNPFSEKERKFLEEAIQYMSSLCN